MKNSIKISYKNKHRHQIAQKLENKQAINLSLCHQNTP